MPSPPDEPRHESPSPTRNSANNPINLTEEQAEEQASDPPNDPNLDPGLMYTWSYDKKYATRWVLKYDPDQPRPEVALNPVFGTLPGLYIGKRWRTRMGAAWDGTHLAPVAGISGKVGSGAWSIALSGGYEDDFDEGYRFVYSGCGGRELLVHPFPLISD
jgi:SAD/SRA domain